MRHQLKLIVRHGKPEDAKELKALVLNTIKISCKLDYNPEQIEAWCSIVDNEERWQHILEKQLVLIAIIEETIVGLSTLFNKNHIDLFFVHKDYQRHGIANQLYAQIEKEAETQKQITAHVSKPQKLFLKK